MLAPHHHTQRMFCLSFVFVPSFSKGLLRLLLSTSLTKPCGRELCGAPRPCDIETTGEKKMTTPYLTPSFESSLLCLPSPCPTSRYGLGMTWWPAIYWQLLPSPSRCQIKACPAEGADTADKSSKTRSTVTASLRLDCKASFQQVRRLVRRLFSLMHTFLQLTRLTASVEDATHIHAIETTNEIAGKETSDGTRQQRGVCPVCGLGVYSAQACENFKDVCYHSECSNTASVYSRR